MAKYTMDISSDNPQDWVLLRYGQLAGSRTDQPGSFDNAHLEFWQRIKVLELENTRMRKIIDGIARVVNEYQA
jgi:hypothetical protein